MFDISKFRKEKKLSQVSFGQLIGVDQAYVSLIEKGKRPFLDQYYSKLSVIYNDIDNYKKPELEATLVLQTNIMMVPLVHQYAYAGYFNGYSDDQYVESLPKIPFIVDHNGKGKYICFEVKGESMNDGSENSYLDGDRLLCREISSEYWQSKLHNKKWDFVIVHRTEGILIKQIVNHDVEKGFITIHSLNPEYENKTVALKEIMMLFNVIELQRPMKR